MATTDESARVENQFRDHIYDINSRAAMSDMRHRSYFPPRGLIVGIVCEKDQVVLLEANGKGGIARRQSKNDPIFPCTKTKKEKVGIFQRIKNWFR